MVLFAQQLQNDIAGVGTSAVFEDIEALPSPERERTVDYGNRERRTSEGGADMRGHVIWTFGGVTEPFAVFRNKLFEEIAQVEGNVGIGILLDDERAGCVLDEESQETVANGLFSQPVFGGTGEGIESFAASADFQSGVSGSQSPL